MLFKFNLFSFITIFESIEIFSFSSSPLRIFLFGDYEFLCSAYGITGANGKKRF